MRVRHLATTASVAAATILFAACGTDGPNIAGSATGPVAVDGAAPVDIVMEDIKFDRTEFTVKAGTTVQFEFTNRGSLPHDAFIGDSAAQGEHEAEMAAMGGMNHGSMTHAGAAEPAVTVKPGETGTITYTFEEPGTYEIGCHQPGHYAAGMKATIVVN